MSPQGRDPSADIAARDDGGNSAADELRAIFEAKARAELLAADLLAPGSDVVPVSGDLLPLTVLVKGLPGPAEASGGASLSGADGAAAEAVLERLGLGTHAVLRILSRPSPDLEPAARVARLRLALESADPSLVIALDAEAAEDVRDALGLPRLAFGRPVYVGGRTVLAVDGLEASLSDPRRKVRVWGHFKALQAEDLPR